MEYKSRKQKRRETWQHKQGLTAEEAMKKIRKGEPLETEEYDYMTVAESMKFHRILAEEGRINPAVADITNAGLEIHLAYGTIKPDDTVKEAERKIDRYFSVAG